MFRAGVSVPINEPRAAIWLSIFHGVIGVSDNTIRAIGGSEFSTKFSDHPGFFIPRNTNFRPFFFNDLVRKSTIRCVES